METTKSRPNHHQDFSSPQATDLSHDSLEPLEAYRLTLDCHYLMQESSLDESFSGLAFGRFFLLCHRFALVSLEDRRLQLSQLGRSVDISFSQFTHI